ncbi:PorV/PorQ family protein [Candidatus Saganbacteria bacterium]|nr:PorV/PorQ family protein [Candidatus Saganbacteria bacterium]
MNYYNIAKRFLHLSFVICHLSFLPSVVAAQTTFDPLTIGVGARALGMGRAYVAVGESADTIFSNPAGLGGIDAFELLSMSANVMEDVTYSLLGGVYPLGEQSAIGLGYVGANIGGIEIRDSASVLPKSTTSFNDSVIFLSFGRRLNERFSWGLNLKYYTQNGYEVSAGSGSCWNLDVGLLQQGVGPFSFGVVGQNLFSSSKIIANSQGENLPLSIKIGSRFFLLGEELKAAVYAPVDLSIAADANVSLQTAKSTTIHTGIEFAPNPFLTLRAGVDQDPQSSTLTNNFTYGATFHYAGVSLHYAYHSYGDFAYNATNYFSLSLNELGWPLDIFPDVFLGQRDARPLSLSKKEVPLLCL